MEEPLLKQHRISITRHLRGVAPQRVAILKPPVSLEFPGATNMLEWFGCANTTRCLPDMPFPTRSALTGSMYPTGDALGYTRHPNTTQSPGFAILEHQSPPSQHHTAHAPPPSCARAVMRMQVRAEDDGTLAGFQKRSLVADEGRGLARTLSPLVSVSACAALCLSLAREYSE